MFFSRFQSREKKANRLVKLKKQAQPLRSAAHPIELTAVTNISKYIFCLLTAT